MSVGTCIKASLCTSLFAFPAWALAGTTAPPTTASHHGAKLVITEKISGHILPDMTDRFIMYSREDRRANVLQKAHVSGWLGHFAHAYQGKPPLTADLFRLDRDQAYKIRFHQKNYYQCKIDGCPTIYQLLESLGKGPDHADREDQSTWDPAGSESCPLHPVSHDYSMRKTGQSKTINGFPAHLYKGVFKTVYEDKQHRRDVNTLEMDFWTTPVTGKFRRIWAIHQKLTARFLKESGADASPWSRYVSRKIWQPMDAFLGDTDSHQHDWTGDVTSKLAKIQGYPVRIRFAWYVDAKACPAPKEPEESDMQTARHHASGGLRGMLGSVIRKHVEKHVEKAVAKHFQPDPDTPVFEYDRNVLSAKLTSIPDDVFEVPAGFVRKPVPTWENIKRQYEHDD